MTAKRSPAAIGWLLVPMLAIGLFTVCPAHAVRPAQADDAKPSHSAGLWQNEDCTNFFYYGDIAPGQAGATIDRYVDTLAASGVTVLLCNTNARRTNYRGDAWQAFWDGFDPAGPNNQPFLTPIPPDHVERYRKMVANMLEVHTQGIDYPARVIDRCRHDGITPWITLRMNDVHENDNLDHPFHSPLWRRPELMRQGDPGYFGRGLDYAHPEVRDHYKALIVETLARYDVDGLELDFMREPYLFSVGREAAGRETLTAWLREIRQLTVEAAGRRGHPIKLGVRVPARPETALALGLDAPAWAAEGLVDVVVVTPRWATLQFDLPLEKWRKLLGDRVTLLGGLEVIYRPSSAVPLSLVTPELAAGAATAVLAAGADAVYLFNYFQDGHPGWPRPEYQRTLRAFASLPQLGELPRRHAVTYRDVVAPGENYQPPLPAADKDFTCELPLGPTPPADWQAEALIEVVGFAPTSAPPQVLVNGLPCEFHKDQAQDGGNHLLSYSVPRAALTGKNHDAIAVQNPQALTLVRLEVRLHPGD